MSRELDKTLEAIVRDIKYRLSVEEAEELLKEMICEET